METNDERRKRRLAQLCEGHGGVRAVAEKAQISWATLDQILKGVLLPTKADGTRAPRSLGDDNARKLEETFKLGRGWFDWPFDLIDGNLYYSLSDVAQGAAQAAMRKEIDELIRAAAKQPPKVTDEQKGDSSHKPPSSGRKASRARFPGQVIGTGGGREYRDESDRLRAAPKKRDRGGA